MTKEGSILHDDLTGPRGSSEISCREGKSGETSDGKKKAVSMGFEVMSEEPPWGVEKLSTGREVYHTL